MLSVRLQPSVPLLLLRLIDHVRLPHAEHCAALRGAPSIGHILGEPLLHFRLTPCLQVDTDIPAGQRPLSQMWRVPRVFGTPFIRGGVERCRSDRLSRSSRGADSIESTGLPPLQNTTLTERTSVRLPINWMRRILAPFTQPNSAAPWNPWPSPHERQNVMPVGRMVGENQRSGRRGLGPSWFVSRGRWSGTVLARSPAVVRPRQDELISCRCTRVRSRSPKDCRSADRT